jgi:hypothetical protein
LKNAAALSKAQIHRTLAAPHHRRDGPVCSRPSIGARSLGPLPAAVEAIPG